VAKADLFIAILILWAVVWPHALDATMIRDQDHVLSASSEKAIRENILLLNIGEQQADAALDRLHLASRYQVVSVLRDELVSEPVNPSNRNLRAVFALNMIELLPELREISEHTDLWLVFVTVNHLLETAPKGKIDSFVELYQRRLNSTLSAASRIALLDGLTQLRIPIKSDLFHSLLGDSHFQVRVAAVENFVATGNLLSHEDRIRRMVEAMQMKPYQARLTAIRSFSMLDANERSKLRSRLPANLCASESRNDRQSACQEALNAGGAK